MQSEANLEKGEQNSTPHYSCCRDHKAGQTPVLSSMELLCSSHDSWLSLDPGVGRSAQAPWEVEGHQEGDQHGKNLSLAAMGGSKSLRLRLQPAVPWEWQEVHQVFPVLNGHGDIRA